MEFGEAFKILEIEPTDDKKKIKVAYSKMLKKYHPEDFPEMFMKINEAYETALEYSEEEEYEEYDYDEVFYEADFEILDEEDEEFSDVFSGEYEWKEKDFEAWLKKFYRILNGEKISFINLKIFLKKFDRFSDNEKNRIRDILNLENVDYEGNLILNSDNILEFEKEYIISRLTDGKTEFEEIRRLYNSKEDKDKAVENFVEKYFHVKKLNFFVFFVFWNIYHGNYECFDIKINKKIYNFFFVLINNLFLKRIVYSYKEIQKIFYRMGIKCEDDIKEEDEILYSLVFVLSSLALVFIWIFSLPVITNMGLKEIAYEDIITSFDLARTFWIVLGVTRVYYDIMIAKRGNNLNMTSMLYVQIILLGSYLISIYFKYEIKDMLLLVILVWLVIKLMIVNSIKYYRLTNYAKKIMDKIY
ncbi:DnaJ domain-containing protein [Leptotrichia sp. oral taxon 223]|uniref:DnaJ domain-containing protein n=1 Tax=Leptotrichia sp. oral taxon 223 TaxID=712363 RepID=UPI0015B9EE9E|nr:DnaJ domain-containing protein [Leptotrichia sp. oral taxon 223]NWO18477.1 DnaJ domain-containing protein [Leptotrichia sp. oral taxon 223]